MPAGGQSEHDLEGACGSAKSVLPSGMGKAFFLLLMRHVLQRGSGICHHPVDERPVDAEGGHLLGEDALGLLEPFLAAELAPSWRPSAIPSWMPSLRLRSILSSISSRTSPPMAGLTFLPDGKEPSLHDNARARASCEGNALER